MTIALEVLARIRGTLTSAPDAGTASVTIAESAGGDLANGTGANQANNIHVDMFSIASGGSLDIDLAGSLVNPLNEPVVFTAIKTILIEADPANTTNLTVGNGANPFVGPFGAGAHTLSIVPGGFAVLHNPSAGGWAVVAGTGDVLKIANAAGATATGRITVIGES
jgi:hypothetical protein